MGLDRTAQQARNCALKYSFWIGVTTCSSHMLLIFIELAFTFNININLWEIK